jgi:hypothetical protein
MKKQKIELKDLDETGKFFEEIENHWEIKVEAVEVRNAELHPEYQKAAAVERKKELEAKGRAKGLLGTLINAISLAIGLDEEEVKKKFSENPKEILRNTQSHTNGNRGLSKPPFILLVLDRDRFLMKFFLWSKFLLNEIFLED